MGWDAFASRNKHSDPKFSRDLAKKFKAAGKRVIVAAGSVDGSLEDGILDCSNCGRALEAATGESCWTEDDWSPEKVRRLAKKARWPALETVDEDERWSVASAREFLEVCAAENLGVHFSW